MKPLSLTSIALLLIATTFANAEDWNRFRGPNGNGVSADSKIPAEFSTDKNLKWKLEMPGPGASCPIVVGDNVFLTCWTGYGTDGANSGNKEDLTRHLVCIDLKTGKQKWIADVKAKLPEDDYQRMIMEHGFASHTPVSDGENVYVFFGKTGVIAFDMKGKQLWQTDVGDGLDQRRWGSSCSPVVYKDKVIVLASPESTSLLALNKSDGKVAWKQNYEALTGNWSTPLIAKVDDSTSDLIVSVANEIWGLNPENGKLRWFMPTSAGNGGGGRGSTISSSFATDGETIVHMGGRNGRTSAFKPGGTDDISKSHVQWTANTTTGHATPIVHDGLIYSVSRKTVTCLDAKTGEKVYQSRLEGSSQPPSGGGRSSGRGGRGGGGDDYASPVIAGDKLIYVQRNGTVHVLQTGKEFKMLATNSLKDGGEFHATPAISGNNLLVRSTKYLYCLGQ